MKTIRTGARFSLAALVTLALVLALVPVLGMQNARAEDGVSYDGRTSTYTITGEGESTGLSYASSIARYIKNSTDYPVHVTLSIAPKAGSTVSGLKVAGWDYGDIGDGSSRSIEFDLLAGQGAQLSGTVGGSGGGTIDLAAKVTQVAYSSGSGASAFTVYGKGSATRFEQIYSTGSSRSFSYAVRNDSGFKAIVDIAIDTNGAAIYNVRIGDSTVQAPYAQTGIALEKGEQVAVSYTTSGMPARIETKVTCTALQGQVGFSVTCIDQDTHETLRQSNRVSEISNPLVQFAPDIPGYTCVGPKEKTISELSRFSSKNSLMFSYRKNPVCTVNYYLEGTTRKLAASTTIEGVGDTSCKVEAKEISGYSVIGASVQTVALEWRGRHTVDFRYAKQPDKVKGLKVMAGKKRATVKWNKVRGAKRYQVAYKKKGAKKFKTVNVTKASKIVKKLKSKKKYTFKVRVGKKVSGSYVYGAWSSSKTVKVK